MPRKRKELERAPEFDRGGNLVPSRLFDGGRVRFSLRTTDAREAEARRAEMNKLWTWRAWDVLHAIATGSLDVGNVSARVKREGEAALAGLRAEAEAKAAGAVPSVLEIATEYMDHYGRGRREEHSVKQTHSRLIGKRKGRGFCQQAVAGQEVGALPFPALSPEVTETAINNGWKASATREAIRNAVSGMASWAIERERRQAKDAGRSPRWDENPASRVEAYERLPRVVTAAERQAVALLEHAEIHQAAYVRVFLHMGLREDELIHTRMHLDLDTDTWVWRIQGRGPDERHGCIQCKGSGWTPKSKRGHRTLLVPPHPSPLRAAILAYLEAYPAEPGDFVFRNPRTGEPWDAGRLDADFKALCARADVTYGRNVPGGITIHDMRATCATRLVQAKERESVIAALLGDTVDTIVKSYVRLTVEDTARAISNGPTYEVSE